MAPVYSVYICYSRACAQYNDCLDRALLLMQKLLKQGYVAPRLKSSLQNKLRSSSRSGWQLRNIHISNDNGSFTFYVYSFLSAITVNILLDLIVYIRSRNCLPFASPWVHPDLWGPCYSSFLFSVCFISLGLSSSCVLCTQCCQCHWIIHPWLPFLFPLTFISGALHC